MVSMKSQVLLRLFTAVFVLCLISIPSFAQDDPDPNSPTPVLLRAKDSKRIYAVPADDPQRVSLKSASRDSFPPNSRVSIFVKNVELMDEEGASAFRVIVEDSRGKMYRFPVVDFYQVKAQTPTYAVTIELRDEIGYWDPPAADGDVLIRITWRGLTSDRARLGYGTTGGSIQDDTVPYSTLYARTSNGTVDVKPRAGRFAAPEQVGYRWSGDRARFLEQAAFGPTAALDSRIRRIGIRTWLAEQFEATYPSPNNPYPNQPLKPGTMPTDCDGDQVTVPDVPVTCRRDTYTMYPLQAWDSKEKLYGDVQLRHRVSWALSQIWVTSGVDIQQSRHMVEYHKILSTNAFGNFRNLMKQMTLNPTMGDYLDMARSTKTNPNENYAREIKQLFTVGLFLLNQNGTLKLDGSNNPIPTYDQNVVNNLTKVLTGWQFCNTAGTCPNIALGTVNFIDPMIISNTNNHDLTAKTLLSWPADPNFPPNNTNIAACANCTNAANIQTYAAASLDQAMDNIFNHPNVGPYISKNLIQQMVTSDPTPAYVGRVAAVFNNNGFGVRGDLKAVVRAILLDPEARGDAKTDPNFGKLREPAQFATNILRTFNVRSADGLSQSDGVHFQRGEFIGMGQLPFRSPTVFNYFPPDYVIPNTALLGPEFALMTTGTSIQRANFVNRLVFTAPAIPVSLPDIPSGTSLDFSDLQALATADTSSNQLVDELNRRMMHGTMSASMKSTIMTAVNGMPTANATDFLNRTRQAVYLVATSSQYQVQR
jgi:uncharacterized protein (DUF1800 family)